MNYQTNKISIMKLPKLFSVILLMAVTGLIHGPHLKGQTTVEVSYYKPLEAAGGGFLEERADFLLRCNPRQSLFVSHSGEQVESTQQQADGNFDMKVWLGEGEAWVYKDLSEGRLRQYAMSIQENHYLIDDVIHPMAWRILTDVKQINGIPVRKARCEHRGRSYTAWFAPSIPISNGPWKLGGLPGLILEAYDDEKEVVFLFRSLRPVADKPIVCPDSRGRKVSLATFLEISEKEFRQYIDFMEARLKNLGSGVDVDIDFNNYSSWEYLK